MTPAEIITEARVLIQDTDTPYRVSDTLMLYFVNQTLKRMAILRPDLFASVAEFTTTAGDVLQTCPADSARLVDIFRVKGGGAVAEVNKELLDRNYPAWVQEASGVPVNFMRHAQNPNKFFVYPAPVEGTVLIGEYAKSPPNYTSGQTITVPPDMYFPVIVDGVVFMAESIDNEHVASGRAKLFLDSFTQALGVSLQARVLTDTDTAGMDRREMA